MSSFKRNASRVSHSRPGPLAALGDTFVRDGVTLYFNDVQNVYPGWFAPTCIVSDGPYGIAGFPGDPPTTLHLASWYEPHIRMWSERATPETTLWFWNTEIGWATVHPVLASYGWEYRSCHIWDKGLGHIAGNANSLTLRKFPVVSEVCVQYVKTARFRVEDGRDLTMQAWLRHEWLRAGLPLSLTNAVCGVRNAATRKYFTQCHLWYYPPVDAFEKIADYANRHGKPSGRPYFSVDGKRPVRAEEWSRLRAKFNCSVGITNVWSAAPVRGIERLKEKYRCIHHNQKPRRLIEIAIAASTDLHDLVWEPFGGLCTGAIVSHALERKCVSAEIIPEYYLAAKERLMTYNAE